jgi:hypothetical protein
VEQEIHQQFQHHKEDHKVHQEEVVQQIQIKVVEVEVEDHQEQQVEILQEHFQV